MESIIKGVNKNIGVISALLLLALIFILPHPIIWDEQWYTDGVNTLKVYGLSHDFLIHNPAAPMHAIVQYVFSPLTHLQSPQIRIVNFLMCISICLLLYKTLKLDDKTDNATIGYSFSLFTLPSFFVIGFFAITEGPCLLFYAISLFFLMKYIIAEKPVLLNVILSGLFLGLAILTRQIFLVCIGPAGAMVFYKHFKNRFPAVIMFGISALIITAPVFYVWKGLVPPGSVFRHHAGASRFSIKHAALSYGYAFFYCMLLMPMHMYRFLQKNWKVILVLAIAGLAGSSAIEDNSFVPMAGLLPHVFSQAVVDVISILFFKVIGMGCLIMLYFLLYELYINRNDFKQVFFVLSMLVILATPLMLMDQFSSRYSMQIAPVLVLFAFSRIKPIDYRMQFAVNIISVTINMISIVTFFI
jgi:4-amino-4-deoxy-L-arabinose transferase-like glycosyltransferase